MLNALDKVVLDGNSSATIVETVNIVLNKLFLSFSTKQKYVNPYYRDLK